MTDEEFKRLQDIARAGYQAAYDDLYCICEPMDRMAAQGKAMVEAAKYCPLCRKAVAPYVDDDGLPSDAPMFDSKTSIRFVPESKLTEAMERIAQLETALKLALRHSNPADYQFAVTLVERDAFRQQRDDARAERDQWEDRAFRAAEEGRELRDALEELYGASDEPHALRCPTNRHDRPQSECTCGVEVARVLLYGISSH